MNYLNPITLKFQGNKKYLEQKFLDYYLERKIYQQRVALVLGTILYLLFSFLDVLMIPEKSHLFLGMRFFIVMPAALFTLALSFQKIYKKISQPALFVTNFIGAVVIIIMIIIAYPRLHISITPVKFSSLFLPLPLAVCGLFGHYC